MSVRRHLFLLLTVLRRRSIDLRLVVHGCHTDPKQQRRGAAGLLMRWGMQKADELGIPMYLESSTDAHEFYKKLGFQDVEVFEVDLTRFSGIQFTLTVPLMIKEPSVRS
jgi:N-acetylglutamate synthase-like GNAT family acetyltransferase